MYHHSYYQVTIICIFQLCLPNLQTLIIGEDCLYNVKSDMVIEHYPNLERLIFRKGCLQKLHSLKICNNDKLKTIDIEGGDYYLENGVFLDVNSVIIESNKNSVILFYIFQIYDH